MLTPPPIYKKPHFWRNLVPFGLALVGLVSFWPEIKILGAWFLAGGQTTAGNLANALDFTRALFILAFLGVSAFLYLPAAFWLVSQFVLPVTSATDRRKVLDRLSLYLQGRHGPAVFIREGEEIANPEELRSSRRGVAFVDLTSAIVLERQPVVTGVSGYVRPDRARRIIRRKNKVVAQSKLSASSVSSIPERPQARAVGPGIVFTERGEKIKGVVSLRRQFRTQPFIKATTRDGFEVFAHIITIYTLGEPPEVLTVGYRGEPAAENLCVLQIDPTLSKPGGFTAEELEKKPHQLIGFVDELDADDKQEIHLFAQGLAPVEGIGAPTQKPGNRSLFKTPYQFDEDRVFKAVYANARWVKDGQYESWVDLPPKVAIQTFRTMVSRINYSDLYQHREAKFFPLVQQFKPQFSRAVRNQGMLSYQFISCRDGEPLRVGQEINTNQVFLYPVRPLRTSKVLRDRGIKVVAATFPEMRPQNPMVRDQLLDYWRSKWQREADITRANYDYDIIRARADEHVSAQKDIVAQLGKIMDNPDTRIEATALSILSALDTFANSPSTKKLLPYETVHMLELLHQWLSYDGQDFPDSYVDPDLEDNNRDIPY